MPQAGSKTGVYRSFITCEDPKGVVECGMKMRRSKSNGASHIMDEPKKVEVRRNTKNLSTRSSSLESSVTSSSSFRVMEVSRGADKLNNMIDSWSNDEKNEDVFATDLVKGPIDLQESLVMLSKLQEASQYMSNFNAKKHERAYSDRYGDQDYIKPRPSSVELKKVIRDSLVRQKLLSASEKGSVYSYSESTPSTSSSQSSSLCHDTSEHSSISSQKAKGPSLIAKLMGIEEYPLKSLQDVEKVSNPQRPAFEIDRLNVIRKPQSVDVEKKTLKEVLDTMRFKGLLRNNSFEELKFESYHSTILEMPKMFDGVSPPIVLIKPICVESSEKEANLAKANVTRGEEAFKNIRKLKKLAPIRRTRGEVDKHGEKETKTINLAAKKAKGSQLLHQNPHEAIDKRVDKIQKVAADNRKPVEKDIPKAKNVSKNKSEDKEKTTLSKKARKPESGSNNTNTRVSRQPSNVTSTSSKCTTAAHNAESESRRNRLKKNEQPVKKPREVKSVIKTVLSEEIVKRTSISHESESSPISSNADPAVQLTKEDENKTYGSHSEGYSNSVLSFLSDATSLCSMQYTNSETAEEVSEVISPCVKNENSVGCGDDLREFLLSSASFLSHIEKCYNLNVNGSTIFRTPSISNSAMCNTRLVLDCASELVESRSFRQQTVSPTSLTLLQRKPRVGISLHKLVEDVCNGIETLRRYGKLASENTIADSLFVMLERDVMCKGVGKETWDLAWRIGFSDEEVEQVASDIERLIFNGLIKEVFA